MISAIKKMRVISKVMYNTYYFSSILYVLTKKGFILIEPAHLQENFLLALVLLPAMAQFALKAAIFTARIIRGKRK